jgi:hypothetical protein
VTLACVAVKKSFEPSTGFATMLKMRRKTTIYLDEELLRAARIAAARSGKRVYQVFEESLRAYLGIELLQRTGARSVSRKTRPSICLSGVTSIPTFLSPITTGALC